MNAAVQALIEDPLYPDGDGKPMAETGIHVIAMIWLYTTLRHFFGERDDVYVAANMYLYYVEGKPKKRRAPDVMIAKGVNGNHERRSFKTWVEGVVPGCIIEVTSKKTRREDLKEKRPTYEKIGIREYFLFDPCDEYLPRQLMGFRLVRGKYNRIKPRLDGMMLSKELGLYLRPEGEKLALYDAKTGVRLQSLEERMEIHAEQQKKVAELEAEIARLKRSRNGRSH